MKQRPDVIINCAAYTNVDGCENDEESAYRVNSIGAQNLAIAANKIDAKIVQISTDYVFEGKTFEYRREYDECNPKCIYGKSKKWGEELVRESCKKHFIIRTGWLYGEGNNFVRTMLNLSKEKKELDIVNDQFGTPTSTVDLAKVIVDLIETEQYGTYHGTCEGECSWYHFAKKIFEIKKIDIKINPCDTAKINRSATRPEYSVLENFKLNLIGLNTFRKWEDALVEYLKNEGY